MKKIALSTGHNPKSKGYKNEILGINEFDESNKIIDIILNTYDRSLLEIEKINKDNLEQDIKYINSKNFDYAIEIHFNANQGNPSNGTELLMYSDKNIIKGNLLLLSILNYLPFKNRGIKIRQDLAFLKKTKTTSFIIELLFMNNLDEAKYLLFPRAKNIIANAINFGLTNLL